MDKEKRQQSGVYSDADTLEDVLKLMVIDKINENFKKAVFKEMKAASPAIDGTENVSTLRQSIEASKKTFYDEKKWKEETLPETWLAFLICGPPGLKLKAMMA
jgi:hypothetical protein